MQPNRLRTGQLKVAHKYPILEFDPATEAMIEPTRVFDPIDIAEHCVLCFFNEAIEKLGQSYPLKVVRQLRSEMGPHPIYELNWSGKRIALTNPRVGAPLAVATLEAAIALGCRKFVACGGAGVLDGNLSRGHLIVPTAAVRDEGTSFHYMPPGRESHPSDEALKAVRATLEASDQPYVVGKTWTTDAFYRETPAKVKRRKAEGCISVEMEASAFFAVAQFRGVQFAQILYAGDDVSGDKWDSRQWSDQVVAREQLLELAIEACLQI